jgi:hypothetical protein
MELMSCALLIDLNGLPNNPKVKASSIVDLPVPLSPIIRVFEFLLSGISVKTLPVLKKFFQRIISNCITYPH